MKLPENWKRVPIREIYDGLYDGPHATPKPSEEGPVFLGIGNVTEDGHFDYSKVRHISEEDYPKWTKRVTPQQGDIVFTYEATLNRYAIIPEGFRGCLGRRMALIRPNAEKIDTRFLHYYFFGKDWRDTIEANKLAGATVDRIPLTQFPEFPISLPPLTVQWRISAILSAYDDLIDNNTRRIEILEEMARRLYEEWFVHFRFPEHEDVSFKESELGEIPEGWHVAKLESLCSKITDGAHKSPPSVEDGMPMASVKDMHNWGFYVPGCRKISEEDYNALVRGSCKPEIYDILIAKDGANLNKHTFLVVEEQDLVLLSSVAIIRPGDEIDPEFLVSQLKSEEVSERIKLSKSGAAIPRIVLKDFKRLDILLPPREIQARWKQNAKPLADMCRLLTRKNENLRAQRDLLLPKLVSGEIDVSDISMPDDKEVEAA